MVFQIYPNFCNSHTVYNSFYKHETIGVIMKIRLEFSSTMARDCPYIYAKIWPFKDFKLL